MPDELAGKVAVAEAQLNRSGVRFTTMANGIMIDAADAFGVAIRLHGAV